MSWFSFSKKSTILKDTSKGNEVELLPDKDAYRYIRQLKKISYNDFCEELSCVRTAKHNITLFPSNLIREGFEKFEKRQKLIANLNDRVALICAVAFGQKTFTDFVNGDFRSFNKLVDKLDDEVALLQLTSIAHGDLLIRRIEEKIKESNDKSYTEFIHELLENGADINAENSNGLTPLMVASHNGYTEAIQALLDNGVDVNTRKKSSAWTALMYASDNGHTEAIQILLENGANINARDEIDWTALICASRNGYTEAVQVLLNNGADVNAKNDNSWTALIFASREGHTETIQTLLANGADIQAVSDNGKTALMFASEDGHAEAIKLLQKNGAK